MNATTFTSSLEQTILLTLEIQQMITRGFDEAHRSAVDRGDYDLERASQFLAQGFLKDAKRFPEVLEILVDHQIAGTRKKLEEIQIQKSTTTSGPAPAANPQMASATSLNTPVSLTAEKAIPKQPDQPKLVQPEAPEFLPIALRSIARGGTRVLPIAVGGKQPLVKWKETPLYTANKEYWATLAMQNAEEIAARFPRVNCCTVAKDYEQGYIDGDTYRELVAGYEAWSSEKFPVTFTTSARDNRVQIHFNQTDKTRALGNIVQIAVDGIELSFRQNNYYVLCEGSVHPSGSVYKTIVDAPVMDMPDKLADFLAVLRQKAEPERKHFDRDASNEPALASEEIDSIVERATNNLSEVGRPYKQIEPWCGTGKKIILSECLWADSHTKYGRGGAAIFISPQGVLGYKCLHLTECSAKHWKEFRAELDRLAGHPLKWGEDDSKVRISSVPEGMTTADVAREKVEAKEAKAAAASPGKTSEATTELDTRTAGARPVFPLWAIKGTSLYERFAKPAMEACGNSKHEEFLFVPAMQLMMNYLSGKIEIPMQKSHLNLFVGMISPYGKFFKSTSAELAQKCFAEMGLCQGVSPSRPVPAEGKIVITQAGSSEGFGILMAKVGAVNAILYNDELQRLIAKMGIKDSAFGADLLTWWGGGAFANNVSDSKRAFAFPAGEYTFGWLFCTTDRSFNRLWPKIAGDQSGLPDRIFWVVGPEKPKAPKPYFNFDMSSDAAVTRELIEKAILQKQFRFEAGSDFEGITDGMNPRSMEMVKTIALYFAVDLGLTGITADCIRRARALVDYSDQGALFLEPIEADCTEGIIQKSILRELRRFAGKMPYRKLCRNLDYGRYGMKQWKQAVVGLVQEREVTLFDECATSGKRATRMIGKVKWDEDEEYS